MSICEIKVHLLLKIDFKNVIIGVIMVIKLQSEIHVTNQEIVKQYW